MKIAHVTSTFPPYQGGTGNVCYYNARELARLGHEVHVFTAQVEGAPSEETIAGAFVRRLRPLVQIGNAPVLPQLFWRLSDFDILHLHYPFILGAEMVRLASLAFRVPVVISLHSDLIGDEGRARLFSVYQKLSAKFTVRHIAMLCAVTMDHYCHSQLRKDLNGQEPLVIELPNGVDIAQFHPVGDTKIRQKFGIPEDAFVVLFVAALDRAHHFKGLDRLLKAMVKLPGDVWLLAVGDGDLKLTYQQQAEELGVNNRVVFAGEVANADLPPFFRSADVTVLPSLAESFGLVLIESMACGTPVIASDVPGARSVVASSGAGYLVQPIAISEWSDRIRRFQALTEAQRKEMGVAGRLTVEERYGWDQIGRRLEDVYRQVLRASEMCAGQSKVVGRET